MLLVIYLSVIRVTACMQINDRGKERRAWSVAWAECGCNGGTAAPDAVAAALFCAARLAKLNILQGKLVLRFALGELHVRINRLNSMT